MAAGGEVPAPHTSSLSLPCPRAPIRAAGAPGAAPKGDRGSGRTRCQDTVPDPRSPAPAAPTESLTQPEVLFAFSVFRVFSELGSHSQNTAWLSPGQPSSLVLWGGLAPPRASAVTFQGVPSPIPGPLPVLAWVPPEPRRIPHNPEWKPQLCG